MIGDIKDILLIGSEDGDYISVSRNGKEAGNYLSVR